MKILVFGVSQVGSNFQKVHPDQIEASASLPFYMCERSSGGESGEVKNS
jgi:hypothetical protein